MPKSRVSSTDWGKQGCELGIFIKFQNIITSTLLSPVLGKGKNFVSYGNWAASSGVVVSPKNMSNCGCRPVKESVLRNHYFLSLPPLSLKWL